MSDEEVTRAGHSRVPAWYWVVSLAALLFECVGCFFYVGEVRLTPEQIATLPLDQAALHLALPSWYFAAFAASAWIGLLGAIGLLLRKVWAVPLLLGSLIATIVQYSAIFIVPEMRAVSSDALLGPILFITGAYGIFMLARLAKRRGWLR